MDIVEKGERNEKRENNEGKVGRGKGETKKKSVAYRGEAENRFSPPPPAMLKDMPCGGRTARDCKASSGGKSLFADFCSLEIV